MDDVGSDFDKMIVTPDGRDEFATALTDMLDSVKYLDDGTATDVPTRDIVSHIIYTKHEYMRQEDDSPDDYESDDMNESIDISNINPAENESIDVFSMNPSETDFDVWKKAVYDNHKINVDFFTIKQFNYQFSHSNLLYQNILLNLQKQELHQVFKDCYVRCIENHKDGTVQRTLLPHTHPEADSVFKTVKLHGLKLTRIPHYFKKYTEFTTVDLSTNNFTELNTSDFPEKVEHLNLSFCENLVSIKPNALPLTNTLDFTGCKKLTTLHYPIKVNHGDNRCTLYLLDTAITSMDKITFKLDGKLAAPLTIALPINFSSFESVDNKMAGINDVVYNINEIQDRLTSFIGAKINPINKKVIVLYQKFDRMKSIGLAMPEDEKTFQEYFPNIKNAYKKYNAYKEIYKKYDVISDPKLNQLYKLIYPQSLMEFEFVLNNNYDIDTYILAKLIKYITA
jgi:hypothetical protein